MNIEIFQHRLLPTLRFSLKSGSAPVDLTGKTVRFVVGHKEFGDIRIRRTCIVLGLATEGRCEFRWETGDTAYAEDGLDGELEWELADGREQTLATFKIAIKPSLGEP